MDTTSQGVAQFYVILLCLSVAFLAFSLGKQQCPKTQIEYRFIPRTPEEMEDVETPTDVLKMLN